MIRIGTGLVLSIENVVDDLRIVTVKISTKVAFPKVKLLSLMRVQKKGIALAKEIMCFLSKFECIFFL